VAEGWLLKQPVKPLFGGIGSKARDRWFVVRTTPLKTVKIEYYSDDSQEKLKGTLTVTGESVLTKTGETGFTITTKGGTLSAAAEGSEERDVWCERLENAIAFAGKARSASVRLAAERAASRRAREAAEEEAEPENNAGCYLVWSEASDGSLIERWSKDVVPGALARFIPQKAVPGYKYKRHGGNSELLRDIRVPARLFKGIATFCKTARESDGILQIFPDKARPFRVYVNIDGKLKELRPQEPVDTTKVKAVAVNGKDNETFVGIARMMPMQFVQHATGTGGFGIFLQNES